MYYVIIIQLIFNIFFLIFLYNIYLTQNKKIKYINKKLLFLKKKLIRIFPIT